MTVETVLEVIEVWTIFGVFTTQVLQTLCQHVIKHARIHCIG